MPSAVSCSCTTAARSGSSRGRNCGAMSTTVTSLPSRAERLRHFAADRARADDEQRRHGLAQIEHASRW